MDIKHKKLLVYTVSVDFVEECYKISKLLPADEKFTW